MKKQKPVTIQIEPTLSERINDHPALEWAMENSKNLLIALLFILALGFFAYRTASSWAQQTGQNYLSAENAYVEMRSTTGDRSNEAANKLQLLIQQQPDLQAKYDGLLSQFLLVRGNTAEAAPLATRALSRTQSENSPYFQEYAQATLLIAEQNDAEALKKSLQLHQQILADTESTYSPLLPLNLLRIAMLQQKLGLEEEINSWQQMKDLAKENGKAVHFESVAQIFREGNVDLDTYIDSRLN